MKKRLLALLLCLLMCASLMPITALADGTITAAEDDGSITVAPAEEENAGEVDITPIWDESMYEKPENSDLDEEGEKADVFLASSGACGDNLTWTLNDNGKLTISGTGDMDGGGPDSYPWAENSEGIKTIVISSGVTSIGGYAFQGCYNLTKVSIANTVTTIGSRAFGFCSSLTSVTIPASVTTINPMPFSGCTSLTQIAVASGNKNFAIVDNMLVTKDGHNLIQVPAGIGATCTVPDGVTTIWGEAFIPGDLKTVILSSTVTNVQTAAFMNCYSLTTIKVASGNTAYAAVDGVLYSKDKTELYYYPQGKSIPEAYTMPDGVETVKAMAFFGKGGLKALILPAGLKTLEIQAFAACSDLLNVTIPASATEIRYGAFEWCDNLNTVNFLGTKEQWNNVNIGEHNEPLTNAKIIYGGGSADVGTPVISSVKAASDSVTVKWGAVSGADKYQVQRKASDGSWETLKTVTAISYTDKSPLMGTSKYRVRAYGYGAWGSWSSAKSVTFNPFTDVESSGKTFEYISWAYNNGIVTGTSATTFSPGNTCTRIQFVMMLWKMHGSPVVGGENPFSDISGTKTTNAILWALDVGIINSGSTFNPSGSITRVNIVMMLWKLAGSPKVSGSNPFTDVSGAKTINAVLWAYQNGITKGTSDTTFSPNKNCTRLQLVTFLYKYNNIYNVI